MNDIRKLLDEREKTHGKFDSFCKRWTALMNESDQIEDPVAKCAYMMITHKLARILNGNPLEIDHWRDIAGYAQLVINQLNNVTKQPFESTKKIKGLKRRGRPRKDASKLQA